MTGKLTALWPKLVLFLRHGEVAIDNNPVENAIRPTAVGKKNWLFVGGEDTGGRSAVIHTLIESTNRHGHEPYAYLKNVLERLPSTTPPRTRRAVTGEMETTGAKHRAHVGCGLRCLCQPGTHGPLTLIPCCRLKAMAD